MANPSSAILTLSLGLLLWFTSFAKTKAQVIDFDPDSSAALGLFNQVNTGANGAATNPFVGNTNGVNGTNGIDVSGAAGSDTTAIYTATTIDATSLATPLVLSIDFETAASLGSAAATIAQLGLTGNTTLSFGNNSANSFVTGRLNRTGAGAYILQTQTKSGSTAIVTATAGSAASISLTASEWYRLEVDLTRTGTASNFSLTVSLYDLGANGLGTPALVSTGTSAAVANASLYTDTTTFAGLRGVAGTDAVSYDNLMIVPEPTTTALLSGGLGILILRRRRRARAWSN